MRAPSDPDADVGGWEVTHSLLEGRSSARRPKDAPAGWTPRGQEPAYTPRRSGRFDQLGVLSTLSAAPPLPSPAITPRLGGADTSLAHGNRSPNLGPQRGDISSLTPRHSVLGGAHQSPSGADNNRSMALDRSSWLPSPRQSFRFQGGDMSVLDGSIMAKHQVLETQEPEFISKLENSLIQKRDGDTSVRNSMLPGLAADLPANVLNVLEEGDSGLHHYLWLMPCDL